MKRSAADERAGLSVAARLLISGTAVMVVMAAVVSGILFSGSDVSVGRAEKADACCWREGVTPAALSELIGIRIPEPATDRRAGHKIGERDDTGVLAFTLPTDDADAYTSRLFRKGTQMVGNLHPQDQDFRPPGGFAHLGLPEPETLVEGLTQGSECPDELTTPEGRHLKTCIDLFAHELGAGVTRIYVKATV
ncbi:hypothetical protein [Streptomyces sp. NBC_00306]|uniref:hypothetical protein n=1 Tax=Streptomyces sp. NBC_00306 TaxID=2975708 RepID=UPI002E27F5F8|nr:hypothetical protein [Streptomyces sp. NBC_00306]